MVTKLVVTLTHTTHLIKKTPTTLMKKTSSEKLIIISRQTDVPYDFLS